MCWSNGVRARLIRLPVSDHIQDEAHACLLTAEVSVCVCACVGICLGILEKEARRGSGRERSINIQQKVPHPLQSHTNTHHSRSAPSLHSP